MVYENALVGIVAHLVAYGPTTTYPGWVCAYDVEKFLGTSCACRTYPELHALAEEGALIENGDGVVPVFRVSLRHLLKAPADMVVA